MPIHIRNIQLKNCGPLTDYELDPKPLTVLYAANERGKTTVVENIVNALFRRKKGEMPVVRESFIGGCKVAVEGIGDGLETYSSGKKTLDDYFESGEVGLPRSLLNLLFVRGAETAITMKDEKVSRDALKALFSRQRVYDAVEKNLPSEIKYTSLEEGRLDGQKRGDNKKLIELRERMSDLESLADRFHNSLSRTDAPELERKKKETEEELTQQRKAKLHHAYELAASIRDTEEELEKLPEHELEKVSGDLQTCRMKSEQLKKEREEASRAKDLEEQAGWLESAEKNYQNLLSAAVSPILALAVAALLFVTAAGALVSAFLLPLIATVVLIALFLLLVVSLIILAVVRFRRRAGPFQARSELVALGEEFERRFGSELNTLADLETKAKQIQDDVAVVRHVSGQVKTLDSEVSTLRQSVVSALSRLGIEPGEDESSWDEKLRNLQTRRKQLEKRRSDDRERLSALGVDESDFLEEDPGETYSRQREQELSGRVTELQNEIVQIHAELDEVRDDLSDHIGRDVTKSGSLSAVARAIKAKQDEYRAEERELLARMIAGIVVNDVLDEFREAEDREIESMLNDPKISNLVRDFTGTYDRLSLSGDEVIVHGEVEQYPLRAMSTGAQEQILLALRIGIAELLAEGNPLFLILDDAFQYSDWNRRETLISETISAVKRGWQVIYFTMDNHIRRRYEVLARRELDRELYTVREI